eukprot:scaffold44284_cov86-Phaeocystis_antarctica.AAC.2
MAALCRSDAGAAVTNGHSRGVDQQQRTRAARLAAAEDEQWRCAAMREGGEGGRCVGDVRGAQLDEARRVGGEVGDEACHVLRVKNAKQSRRRQRKGWRVSGRAFPREGAPAEAERHTASHGRRRRAARRALQHRVRDRAAVPERRHAARAKQVLFLRRASHRCQLHRPKGHLPSPSSGGRDHWVEDNELRVARSCAA